jgi:hypothetical protein
MKVSERYEVGITPYRPADADDPDASQLEHVGDGTAVVGGS